MTTSRFTFGDPAGILYHYIHHMVFILPFAAGAALLAESPILTLVSATVAGILIDLDHLVDYMVEVPPREWTLRNAVAGDHLPSAKRVFVLLHGYDTVILIGLLTGFLVNSAVGLGLAVGMLVHIATDQIDYDGHPLRYVLLFRFYRSFDNCLFIHSQSRRDPENHKSKQRNIAKVAKRG